MKRLTGPWQRAVAAVLLGFGPSLAVLAADPLPPPVYELKQETPTTGSRIPRKQVWSSKVPINRTFAQLTPEEQAIVKSAYESIAPGDEPPYPAEGLLPIYRAVRTIVDKYDATGEASIFVEVDEKGSAVSASIAKSIVDDKVLSALAKVLMLTPYKPAVCGGRPCRMSYPFRMTFTLIP